MALILYHDLPDTAFPPHVVRHQPPVRVVAIDTLVPVRIVVRVFALTKSPVLRFTLQAEIFVTVELNAPSGIDTAAAKSKRADRPALAKIAGSDAWRERRTV
jgi:hypothetical protein